MWAAQAEADVRTTVDTARLKGANPFQTILDTLVSRKNRALKLGVITQNLRPKKWEWVITHEVVLVQGEISQIKYREKVSNDEISIPRRSGSNLRSGIGGSCADGFA